MKLFFAILITIVIGYLFLNSKFSPWEISLKSDKIQPGPSPTPAMDSHASESPNPSPTPDSVAVGKEDSLKSLPEGTEYWETWGWIEQHLRDGYILYKGAGPNHVLEHFAVLYPGAENLSDGTQIKFKACYAGTYQYTTVVGSTNTIDKLLYLTPEMLPKPKPGAWMWERHGALSQ